MSRFNSLILGLVLLTPELASARRTIHAEMWEANRDVIPVLARRGFARSRNPVPPAQFSHTVYGFYPAFAPDEANIPWEHLTHLSYFTAEVSSTGAILDDNDWATYGADFVSVGHSYGVKVTLTAALFDDAAIATLLASSTARTTLINNLLDLVQGAGADGVCIDFESIPTSGGATPTPKQNFVTFMGELSDAFHTEIPGSHVSIAMPAVDWNGTYDFDQLAIRSDALLIMAYDYYGTWGDPGPIAPVGVPVANSSSPPSTTWGPKTVHWTIRDYLTWGGSENSAKFVLGVPLYGQNWPTTSGTIPGTRYSGPSVITPRYDSCQTSLTISSSWDEDGQVPFRAYDTTMGYWRQLFCENDESLGIKFDLVLDDGFNLGGVMFWALGYATADDPMWGQVDTRFKLPPTNTPPVAIASAQSQSTVGDTVTLDGSDSSDPDGDTLTYAWTQVQGPQLTIDDSMLALATVTFAQAGTYRFRLTVGDAESSDTADVQILVEDAIIDDDGGDPDGGDPDGGDSDDGDSDSVPNPNTGKKTVPSRGGCNQTGVTWLALLPLVGLLGRRSRR